MSEPLFDRLKRPPAYRVVAESLRHAIVARQILAGDLLPIEGDLARQFGVTRSTLREGLRALEQAGFLSRKGKRLVVTHPSHDAYSDDLSAALTLQQVSFLELWQTSMELETLAAGLAADSVTALRIAPAQAERLRANLSATAQALEDKDDLVALDVEFHALLAEAAGNRALIMAREPLARLFYPAFRASMFPKQSGRRLLQAHGFILMAVLDGDAGEAREWMRKHITDFRRGYEMAGLDVEAPISLEEP